MMLSRVRLGWGVGLLLSLASCGQPQSQEPQAIPLMGTSITEIQNAILEGQTTCQMVVEGYLQRIATYDKPTGLNAITVINERAVQKAAAMDQMVASGTDLPPLFCAPILVKDNFDTHDMVTTGGSIALEDSYPPDDAFMVARLREAGAIIIAKTNMAEWAFNPRETISSSFGLTRNAYDLDRVPAGSSGGTASGVAASFAPAGLGSDTGNSIRGPTSHLALFGIRSTIGLTSRDGVIPLAFDRDIAGPMTQTVKDAAMIFNVIAGYDPADPVTEHGKGERADDYTSFLNRNALRGARIGILTDLVQTEDADPRITALFETAIEDMRDAGAIIIDAVTIPNFETHLNTDNFCPRFRHDMYNYLGSLENPPFRDVASLLETETYVQSPEVSRNYAQQGLEYFAGFPLEEAPEDWQPPCPTFPNHESRNAYLNDVIAAMDEARVDVLVYPTWTNPPAPVDDAFGEYKGDNSQLVAPATGMPAATVPMGFVDAKWPAGLQILARPFREDVIFALAYAYEQATRHRRNPELFPEIEDE